MVYWHDKFSDKPLLYQYCTNNNGLFTKCLLQSILKLINNSQS